MIGLACSERNSRICLAVFDVRQTDRIVTAVSRSVKFTYEL